MVCMGKDDPELSSLSTNGRRRAELWLLLKGNSMIVYPNTQPTCFNIIVRDLSLSELFLCRFPVLLFSLSDSNAEAPGSCAGMPVFSYEL